LFSFFLFSDPKSQTGNQIKGPASAHKEAGLLAYKKPFSAEKSFFQHLSLDFFAPACYNQRSFILTKAMMRTNRSSFPMTQRGLPRIPGAASSLPCIGLLPPQSAEENLCRVRPLQHSEWRVLKGTQFGWNRGTREIFRRFIP